MKKLTLLFLLSIFSVIFGYSQEIKQKMVFGRPVLNTTPDGLIRCASTEYEQYLQENDPKRMTNAEFEAWLAPLVEKYKNSPEFRSQSGEIITIPVVVHVIHSGQPVGTAPNIPDGQVESQITVLNQDFRRMIGTPGYNTNAVGADTMIQFALAKVDPNGNPTNGIVRHNMCQDSWSKNAVDSTVKPATIWDSTQYMNMWAVKFSASDLLGYAQFPSNSNLEGLNPYMGAANTDGVVSNYSYFGSRTLFPGGIYSGTTFDKGRTMTHEVGHYLGLRHIWAEDGAACLTDDYCNDTPRAASPNYGCPPGRDTCPSQPGLDMIQNYMDYTNDSCMNIFTVDQKARITAVMNNATRRESLKTSTKDQPIPLFANDAELKLERSCSSVSSSSCSTGSGPTVKITIYNRGTSPLTSAVITYNINGGTSYNYNWSGNLAQDKFATFDMPITNGINGTLNAAITTANGVTDQRASNNSVSAAYTVPAGPTNYTFNNYVFRFQKDRWAAETSWTLKNQAGTTLYSSIPYSSVGNSAPLPALVTQNWILPSNDCYIFTINDSYGDGICCAGGNGYYDIKSADGSIVVASGGNFGSTESKAFSVNLLSNDTFETLNDIYVYPNPAKNILNIAVPSGIELVNNVAIYNYLGQIVTQKTILTQDDLSIDTSNFSNGVYLITVSNGIQSKTLRFIKE
jgi:hypothetical protein